MVGTGHVFSRNREITIKLLKKWAPMGSVRWETMGVLKIPIELAGGVSKFYFFARAALVSAGKKILYFVLMTQKKRKTMEKETRPQRRHDSLHCPRVKCNFDRKTLW